ncbi:MAG: SUF system NifU family Fe-S cluster assembly protein [Elusimicrobia bacterium RIFCSPLOWO2_01_FULL_59_12]|nr:MAG: SUF system NifU family Fe-S cluster assembly protein [Elusimicrobia bacterium RIFCSPLOWO2_01_FULL_59_12]
MSELNDLYQEVIVDHSMRPHNYHAMADATRKAEGYNPLCGDQVTVYLKLDGDTIRDVSFEGRGCAISKASASVLTEAVKDKTRAQAQALFDAFRRLVTEGPVPAAEEASLGKLAAFSGVHEFPTRVKCAVLAWHALHSALEAKTGTVSTE